MKKMNHLHQDGMHALLDCQVEEEEQKEGSWLIRKHNKEGSWLIRKHNKEGGEDKEIYIFLKFKEEEDFSKGANRPENPFHNIVQEMKDHFDVGCPKLYSQKASEKKYLNEQGLKAILQ